MNREDIKKYLQMLGLELQKQEVTGQILLADGVVMLLDVRKPKIRKDIDAYLKGDKTAIHIPSDIDSHFGGGGTAIREVAMGIASSQILKPLEEDELVSRLDRNSEDRSSALASRHDTSRECCHSTGPSDKWPVLAQRGRPTSQQGALRSPENVLHQASASLPECHTFRWKGIL